MAIPTLAECPRLCECKWKSGKESVVCWNANLTVVPLHLDTGTQILDLTGNTIPSLKNEEFSKAGLVNLQKIYLSKCKLKTIERFSFKNLINLVDLDLSYNAIAYVPTHAFDSIPEIRELKLNGNPIQRIANNAFVNIPQLVRLELSSCKISNIESRAFVGLSESLEWLKLDANRLTEVDASSFTIFQNLHGLELTGNPWNCSCKLRNLREWMLRLNVPYDIPPVCVNPKRLYQKSWRTLELDEFACAPKIAAEIAKVKGVEGNNVTLLCNIHGVPQPNVKWLYKSRVIANLTNASQSSSKKMYILNLRNESSELTIQTLEMQDAGTYMCLAENKAGKVEAVVSLAINKKAPYTKLSQSVILISVLLGISLTFVCCVLAVCIVVTRRKRMLNWHSSECRRDDNYEKIEMKQKEFRDVNGGVNRESAAIVSRKNGDYSVVPATDTDHEIEEEEESTLEITTPGTSAERKWSANAEGDRTNHSDNVMESNSSEESRDNISRIYNTTFGSYKPKSSTEPSSVRLEPHTLSAMYRSAPARPIPDVVGNSPYPSISSRTQSENGSTNDINELFCTLPRKRDLARYKSCDSQSPLLADSRYGSESGSSSESFARRISVETQRYHIVNSKRYRSCKTPGGSLLNLTRDERSVDPTPLLDVKGLETRISQKPTPSDHFVSENTNPYDYHAAQLERFLEEYRFLQKQLTKMKESCTSSTSTNRDPIRDVDTASIPILTSPNENQSLHLNSQVNSPNSNQSIQDSVEFKQFENELTKYLMSRSPSSKNFNNPVIHN
ncbi:uncharacterized protein LOC143204476 [Rhynchophorus ferrugineus]|uniref:uncharacterized protein LOC143204476 n=1 Tax=Rhynchophorus ferrugineus TaxID=354439 RepID=UPI003FCD78D0